MSDNFEFDDDDDLLLNAICTPTTENTTPIKRLQLNEPSNENSSPKKCKLDGSSDPLSPVFPLPQIISVESIKETHNSSILNAVKRIFPGPAGILADENITKTASELEVCSQSTSSIFKEGPWDEMSHDFKISSSLYLYEKFNIAWIKKEATANQFTIQKAPFLAGVLLSLEVSDGQKQKSVNVTLKDMTGTIQGNILHNLYEEYASHFTLGSVLILVDFGVLSCTCEKCDNHHLTVTPKNLSAIYSGKAKIVIKKIRPQEVITDFCQRKKELAQKIRRQTLTRRNSSSSSNITFNTRRSFTLNNSNVTAPYNAVQKRSSEENVIMPKFRSTPEYSVENRLKLTTLNSAKCSNEHKMHTFKKAPLLEITHNPLFKRSNKASDISTSTENCSNEKKDIPSSGSPTISCMQDRFSMNTGPCSSKTVYLNNARTTASYLNNSPEKKNSEIFPKSRDICEDTLENRLKAPSSNDANRNKSSSSKGPNKTNTSNGSDSSIQRSSNQISVKVDSVEHENIWEEALHDVDLDSFFRDDF